MNTQKDQKKRKYTTIFKQLILNVIFPVVIALVLLASLNYIQTSRILTNASQTKNYVISNEIKHIMELQDIALETINQQKDSVLRRFSYQLVESYFAKTNNIEDVDLKKVRDEVGMSSKYYDIYVINRNGVVVNTTFDKDMGINFFDFGETHKNLLLKIFDGGEFLLSGLVLRLKQKDYGNIHIIPHLMQNI
jgi:hypothetical protein